MIFLEGNVIFEHFLPVGVVHLAYLWELYIWRTFDVHLAYIWRPENRENVHLAKIAAPPAGCHASGATAKELEKYGENGVILAPLFQALA